MKSLTNQQLQEDEDNSNNNNTNNDITSSNINNFRPVYVPRRRLRHDNSTVSTTVSRSSLTNNNTNNERKSKKFNNNVNNTKSFHGAFTGGFIAGYNNTVGTEDGWETIPSYKIERQGNNVLNYSYTKSLEDNNYNNKLPTQSDFVQQQRELSINQVEIQNDTNDTNNNNNQRRELKRQRIEDYMDDQDHNEWGGPTVVGIDYTNAFSAVKNITDTATAVSNTVVDDIFFPTNRIIHEITILRKNDTIGRKLLRHLGWTGRDVAYATVSSTHDGFPNHDNDTVYHHDDDNTDNTDPEQQYLTNRNIRKIHLRTMSSNVYIIPEPKLDMCGLGYSPFVNAPEFEAYQQQRKKKKRQQQQLKQDQGSNKNVYRLSNDVLNYNHDDVTNNDNESSSVDDNYNGDEKERRSSNQRTNRTNDDDDDDHLPSRRSGIHLNEETLDDIIGTKSASGFALHDDDDDGIYDDDTANNVHGGTRTHSKFLRRSDTRTILSTTQSRTLNPISSDLVVFQQDKDDSSSHKVDRKMNIDTDRYDMVLYEHKDSDPEDDWDDNQRTGKRSAALYSKSHGKKDGKNKLGVDFKSLLSSWANEKDYNQNPGSTNDSNKWHGPITSDGLGIIQGFVLGSFGRIPATKIESNSLSGGQRKQLPLSNLDVGCNRFRGPDVPSSYRIQPHTFGPNETPFAIHALVMSKHRKDEQQKHKNPTVVSVKSNPTESIQVNPVAVDSKKSLSQKQNNFKDEAIPFIRPREHVLQKSNIFEGISQSMNNRFASSALIDSGNGTPEEIALPAGLSRPEDIRSYKERTKRSGTTNNQKETKIEPILKVTRTLQLFVPHTLLCKRFRVPSISTNHNLHQSSSKVSVHSQYHEEILQRVGTVAATDIDKQLITERRSIDETTSQTCDELQDLYREEAKRIVSRLLSGSDTFDPTMSNEIATDDNVRPALSIYRSIFSQPIEELPSDISNVVSKRQESESIDTSNVERMAPLLDPTGTDKNCLDSTQHDVELRNEVQNDNTDSEVVVNRIQLTDDSHGFPQSTSLRDKRHTSSSGSDDSSDDQSINDQDGNKDKKRKEVRDRHEKRRHRKKLKWKKHHDAPKESRSRSSKKSKKRKDKRKKSRER